MRKSIITVLILLMSVTVARAENAEEVNYTVTSCYNWDCYTQRSDGTMAWYFDLGGEEKFWFVVKADEPFALGSMEMAAKYVSDTHGGLEVRIEGSNNETDWKQIRKEATAPWAVSDDYFNILLTTKSIVPYQYYRVTFVYNKEKISIRQLSVSLYTNALDGAGTATDPYLLEDACDLWLFASKAAANNSACATLWRYDIDMTGIEWTGIDNPDYAGTIEGNGHIISNLNGKYGLFKTMGAATVKDLGFVNVDLVAPGNYGGVIAAEAAGATFQNCFVTGRFTLDTQGAQVPTICGLVGHATGNAQFTRCYAASNTGDDTALHLPLCAYALYEVTATDCFYTGEGTVIGYVAGESVDDTDVASGKLAYLLNGQPADAAGPYYQKLGKDTYPVLQGDKNYVYLALDNTTYTNACPHRDKTGYEEHRLQCVGEGNAAYYVCNNPVCQKVFLTNGTPIYNAKEAMLSYKPVVVAQHPDRGWGEWKYTKEIVKDNVTYHNAMSFTIEQDGFTHGDYIVTYTVLDDDPAMNVHCFYTTNFEPSASLCYFVNGKERTAMRQTMVNDGTEHHYVACIDNLKKNDIVRVMMPSYSKPWSSYTLTLTVAIEKPLPLFNGHQFHEVPYQFDCVEGGYNAHIECSQCGYAFSSDAHATTNEDLVPLNNFRIEPTHQSHNYVLADQPNADGLLDYGCTNDHCSAHDPARFVIPHGIDDEDIPVSYADGIYTAVEAISLRYGHDYNVPVAFTAPSVTFTSPVYEGAWTSWCVPFAVTTDDLATVGFDAAYIEGIHRYDTDDDGTIDHTTLEIIRITNGTLRAGTPYLVRTTGNASDINLACGETHLIGIGDCQPLHTETVMAAYDFVPAFVSIPAEEAQGNYYIVGSGNKLGPTSGIVCALDWYLKITGKGSPFDALQSTQSIGIRVVGEEDETTGIFTPYAADEQTEEIYDLSGRRLDTVPAQGLYIQGNKVKMGK